MLHVSPLFPRLPFRARPFARSTALHCALLTLVLAVVGLHREAGAAGASVWQREASFEKNLGQHHDAAIYRSKLADLEATLLSDATLVVGARPKVANGPAAKIALVNASRSPTIREEERTIYTTNYFRKGERNSFVDVPHYSRITYMDVYPGIDLAYHITDARLEYDFIVAPGARAESIALKVEGADVVEVLGTGELAIRVAGTTIKQRKPIAYQELPTGRHPIDCGYHLAHDGSLSFLVGVHDPDVSLIIDPVIEYSSLIGGSSNDFAQAVKVGPGGYIYVAGSTSSTDFPIVGAYDSSLGASDSDVFVTKVDPSTGRAVYSTFIGGSKGSDSAYGLAVDSSGAVYVTGLAGTGFPTTAGAYQTTATAPMGFVAKLSPAGNILLYSTYVRGTQPAAIAVDASGQAAISGTAGTSFSTTSGAFQPTYRGSSFPTANDGDAFALLLNANGSAAVFATFLGGAHGDAGRGIAIDSTGAVVVVGETSSTDFPTATPLQASLASVDNNDGFLTILAADGRSLVASTYLGAGGSESIADVALDPFGNIVVAVQTSSLDFPLVSPLQAATGLVGRYISTKKGVLAKIARSPLRVVFSTFVGGGVNCCEYIDAVAVDAAGDIYVSGRTDGNPTDYAYFAPLHTFLTSSYLAPRLSANTSDLFFAQGISRDGKTLRFKTALAQSAQSSGPVRIAARNAGQLAVAGGTASGWYPTAAANGQGKNSNYIYFDAFAMSLAVQEAPLALISSTSAPTSTQPVTLTATSYSSQTTGTVTFLDGTTSLGTATLVEGIASFNTTLPVGVRRLTAQLGAIQSSLLLLPVSPAACP